MQNLLCSNCGGCPLRGLSEEQYQSDKLFNFKRVISSLKNPPIEFDESIFIKDGFRRRGEMEFCIEKKELKLGFNEAKSHNIVNIKTCSMLTEKLNVLLPKLHDFIKEFSEIPVIIPKSKKHQERLFIRKGSIRFLEADNGIDIILILPLEINVEHRMLISEFVNRNQEIIRFSYKVNNSQSETVVCVATPKLYIKEYDIEIPSETFLQASKHAQDLMIEKVLDYLGTTTGKIADLFCGLGTFTYPLALNKDNKITSIDSSQSSLKGLEKNIASNQIQNVKVINRNLFKDPLDEEELKEFDAIVIDPPRAGAHEQCRKILELTNNNKPKKIVFISCNPQTFVYDANLLIEADYVLKNITLIDQFVYSHHSELIALFTLNPEK
ncbi:MAG: class I SAM-dependent RNA methyltransferase [Alphaproteobacteria bacterium]|nr:class I SAM-dependent RNA methyltransferase [Alphaproteobacteria bacterium]